MIDFLVDKKNTIYKKEHSSMAQTTRLASFGPIIITTALSVAYCYIIAYMYNGILVRKKKHETKKRTLT